MENKTTKIKNNMFNKIYGIVSFLLIIMITMQVFVLKYLQSPLLIKVLNFGFWYVIGAFTALFIVRRVAFSKQHSPYEKNSDLSN